jgi:hypothetical protein
MIVNGPRDITCDANRVGLRSVTRSSAAPARVRGGIDELPSGALRVRVYAGVDPVSKRRHYLTEIIAAGRGVDRPARRVRDRLISQVEERRNPRTKATVDLVIEAMATRRVPGLFALCAVRDLNPTR